MSNLTQYVHKRSRKMLNYHHIQLSRRKMKYMFCFKLLFWCYFQSFNTIHFHLIPKQKVKVFNNYTAMSKTFCSVGEGKVLKLKIFFDGGEMEKDIKSIYLNKMLYLTSNVINLPQCPITKINQHQIVTPWS